MRDAGAKYPPGAVGIISGELTRYADFSVSLLRLGVPSGSSFIWTRGVGVAGNLNEVIRRFLARPEHQWVWLLGDDHVFDSDMLLRLLARDVDVVSPLCSFRSPPFLPHVYRAVEGSTLFEKCGWEAVQPSGLQKVDASGTAGILIKRHIFERLRDPWYEVGKTAPDALGEDLWLCKKIGDLGVSIYVDCDERIGHQTTITLYPEPAATGVKIDYGHGFWTTLSIETSVQMAVSDFDTWRAVYPTLTDDNQKDWHRRIIQSYPPKLHGDTESVLKALQVTQQALHRPITVLEIGGGTGGHAAQLLGRADTPITTWTNIEFCDELAAVRATPNPHYQTLVPKTFRWWQGELTLPDADVTILSHIIEHFPQEDLRSLIAALRSPRLYVEAPIAADGLTTWAGYCGTHILECGWDVVDALFAAAGYQVEFRDTYVRRYAR
jgi:hypothetical protein